MRIVQKKKICSLLAAALLLSFAMTPVCFSASEAEGIKDAKDMAGHWSKPAVMECGKMGILKGYGGQFRPDDPVTRAEFAVMINRAYGFSDTKGAEKFSDVPEGAWFAEDLKAASAAGYMTGPGRGKMAPERNIAREEAFVMLARVYKMTAGGGEKTAYTAYADEEQVSFWARDAVSALTNAEYISGAGGKVYPKANMTRGEAAQLLCNLIGTMADRDTAGGTHENLTIRTAGVTVKDAVVSGDLFIAAGVGEGEVTLENVTVKGRLLAAGGGENSLHFSNCDIKELVITKTQVRVVLENNTIVAFALAMTGGNVFEITGGTKIETLTIIGEGVTVKTEGAASIGTLNADAGNTKVEMGAGTIIGTANLNGETSVTGPGKITTANINMDGCSIETKPETVHAKEGVNATVGGQPAGEEKAPSTSGNSGGAGGSSESGPAFDSHNVPNKTNVPFGTPFEELSLPGTALLKATNGATASALLAWDQSTYDAQEEGLQTVTAMASGNGLPSWAPASISIQVRVGTKPVPAALAIRGETVAETPAAVMIRGSKKHFTVQIKDQFGLVMSGQTVTFSIEPAVSGVSVSQTGTAIVAENCTAGGFTLKAVCENVSAVHSVTITAPVEEKAPQVRNLAVVASARDLNVCWTTPSELPYPVKYKAEFADEQGRSVSWPLGSYESSLLNYEWNWGIMEITPRNTGTYYMQVTTIAPHNQALNSDPAIYEKPVEVESLGDKEYRGLVFMGIDGSNMQFELIFQEDSVPPEDGDMYFIDFDFGTGWRTTFVTFAYEGKVIFYVDTLANSGGEIDVADCAARITFFKPILSADDRIQISLTEAADVGVTEGI